MNLKNYTTEVPASRSIEYIDQALHDLINTSVRAANEIKGRSQN